MNNNKIGDVMYKRAIVILTLLLSMSCSFGKVPSFLVPEDIDTFCQTFINYLSLGEEGKFSEMMNESLIREGVLDKLNSHYHDIKNQSVLSRRMTEFQSSMIITGKETIIYYLAYEYQFESVWAYYYLKVHQSEEKTEIADIYTEIQILSKAELNKFTFQEKNSSHIIVFITGVFLWCFILFTIYYIIKTKENQKILWIIASLFSIVRVSFNWTTSEFITNILSIHIIGIIRRGITGPWIISLGIPIFAIAFWLKILIKRNMKRKYQYYMMDKQGKNND